MNNEQQKIQMNSDILPAENTPRGAMLEYRIQRLFFAMGYYSRTGIIVRSGLDSNADVITDLDVFGVYIHKNFISKNIWADCKSGRAKPLERLSWLKGVRSIVNVDDVIFVKSGVRTSTKHYAQKSGIMILDEQMLTKLESDYEVNSEDWSGPWNPATQHNRITQLRNIDRVSGGICSRAASFISSTYWCLDDYARVKKSLTAIGQLSEYEQVCQNNQDKKTIKWAILQLIPMFTLATLNICRNLYFLNDKEKEIIVRNNLISSDIPIHRRAEIIEATYKMAIGLLVQQNPTAQLPEKDLPSGLIPPPYFGKYYDLILRITSKPNYYFDILRLLDYSLQEYALRESPRNVEVLQKLVPNYQDASIGVKTILHFVIEVCNVPKELFSILL